MCVLTIYKLISLKTLNTVAFSNTALFLTLIRPMMCVLGVKTSLSLQKNTFFGKFGKTCGTVPKTKYKNTGKSQNTNFFFYTQINPHVKYLNKSS